MLSLKDIEEASFRRAGMKGYHTEDVDDFLDEVRESYEKLLNDNAILKSKLSEALERNRVMTSDITAMKSKIETYKSDGDEIKYALISAHKTADITIREAKNRANEIIAAAQKTADDQLGGLDAQVKAKEKELELMKQAVSEFRSKIFAMYKDHLAMIDQIPVYAKAPEKAEEPTPAPVPEEPAEPVPAEEKPVYTEPQKEPAADATREFTPIEDAQLEKARTKEETASQDTFDFSNFIVDSTDFHSAMHKARQDLKFGDEYDISKDN